MSIIDLGRHTFPSPEFKKLIKESVTFFCGTPVLELPPNSKFVGTGVYALYYIGNLSDYSMIVDKSGNEYKLPIYVGKAVPTGWRQARSTDSTKSAALYTRLREHSRGIDMANNIALDDFRCRFMILANDESDLIGTVEAALIREFQPLWNCIIDGFGNHDPGKGRYDRAISEWDTLHPGRIWVNRLSGEKPKISVIKQKIEKYSMSLK